MHLTLLKHCRQTIFIGLFMTVFLPLPPAAAEIFFMDPAAGKMKTVGTARYPQIPLCASEFHMQLHNDFFTVRFKLSASGLESKLKSGGKKNDDLNIFAHDVIEFIVSPQPETGVYYHIAVTPAGTAYTAKQRDTSWAPPLKIQTSVKNDLWQCSIQIPYSAIGTVRPADGTVWRANFGIKVPSSGNIMRSASWSGAIDFHNIADMGEIRFTSGEAVVLEKWYLDQSRLRAKLRVPENMQPHRAECIIGSRTVQLRKSGSIYELDIPFFERIIEPEEMICARLRLLDKDKKILWQVAGSASARGIMELETDSFYYTPQMKQLRYRHQFQLPATLKVKNANNQTVFHTDAAASGTVDLQKLPAGKYFLELTNARHHIRTLFFITGNDRQTAPIPNDAELTLQNNKLLLGKKHIFFIGASRSPHQVKSPFKNPFNLRDGNLPAAENAVIMQSMNLASMQRTPYLRMQLHAEEKYNQRLANCLQAVPGNRIISRMAYEAEIPVTVSTNQQIQKLDNFEYYKNLYSKIKKIRPERLCSIHLCDWELARKYFDCCDIFETASWRSGYHEIMMNDLPGDMEKIRKLAPQKPIFFWLGGSIPNSQCRSAEELRGAIYCAVINDLNGVVIHLGHAGISPDNTRLWSLVNGINTEISVFYDEFASGTPVYDFVKKCDGNFIWSARRNGKKIHLLILNLQGSRQTLKMTTANGMIHHILTAYEPLYLTFDSVQ